VNYGAEKNLKGILRRAYRR